MRREKTSKSNNKWPVNADIFSYVHKNTFKCVCQSKFRCVRSRGNPPTHCTRTEYRSSRYPPAACIYAATEHGNSEQTKKEVTEKRRHGDIHPVLFYVLVFLSLGPHGSDHLQRNNLLVTSRVRDSLKRVRWTQGRHRWVVPCARCVLEATASAYIAYLLRADDLLW